jgi:hypothetical protein
VIHPDPRFKKKETPDIAIDLQRGNPRWLRLVFLKKAVPTAPR